MKKENVLCVSLSDMRKAFDMNKLSWKVEKEELEGLPFCFKSRESAETDFTMKQIIPYAIMTDKEGRILIYKRAGSEKRLSGIKSAGIGGHVNDMDGGDNLLDIVLNGLIREVKEEIGISLSKESFSLMGMINEEESEVGHCHTGLVFKVNLEDASLYFNKEISSPEWCKGKELKLSEFELWSSLAIGLITPKKRSVHITLVGGQPAPVYHGIVATEPDYIVFVYSQNSAKALTTLKKEISIESESIKLDPVNPTEILSCAVQQAKKYENDSITVNITSGLKSWSHFFSVVFDKLENASVVYMDQNNVLWNYRTMNSMSGFAFDMQTNFRLYGNPLEHYRRFEEYDEADRDCLPKIREARNRNHRDFNELTAVLTSSRKTYFQNNRQGKIYAGNGISYVKWEKGKDDEDGYVELELKQKYGNILHYEFSSRHITDLVFNTGWFEFEVASILSKWSKAKEICMNCRFPSKENLDKNEVDIIVNTGTKLLFVECKTQISKNTDIDKFRSVVKNYGGLGSKGIFITEAPMNPLARQKCEDNSLLHFSLMKDGRRNSVLSELFKMLDKELYNINSK